MCVRRLVKVKKFVSGKVIPDVSGSLKNDWVIMDTFEAIENDNHKAWEKQKLHDIKMDVKRTLDIQMEERVQQKKAEKAREDKFLHEQKSVMEQWNFECTLSGTMGHTKMLREKAIRNEQCRLNRLRKQKVIDAEKAAEREDVAVCQRELRRQEQEKIDKKNEQKSQNTENMAAVMQQFGKRERVEKEEKEEDIRMMQLKMQMMDDEEVARKAAFQARVGKYEKFSAKYQEAGAGAQIAAANLKIEKIILRDAAAKEAKDIKREVDDAMKVKTTAEFLQRENKKAENLKKEKDRKLAEEDFALSLKVRMAGESYTAGAWERQKEERKAGANYARELMLQRMEVERRVTKVEMGDTERIMNRRLLDKLGKDPKLIKAITTKMFAQKPMKESDKFKYGSSLPGFSIPGQLPA